MIRLLDIVFSALGLLLLSPLLLVVYVAVCLESPGGGFYLQTRTGRGGKPFKICKFRSMRTGTDRKGLLTVGDHDPRVTRTGYVIRKLKIDELPQLFNVLRGDMSLVGPRPEVERYTRLYNAEQRRVLTVRPGITDWASIEYVDENELLSKSADPEKTYVEEIMPAKIRLNMRWVDSQSVGEYFRIIFSTLRHLFR